MSTVSELLDAKIAASEARTDSKFGQLIARLDSIDARMGHLEQQQGEIRMEMRQESSVITARIRGAAWGAASVVIGSMIGIVALVFTVLPWAMDRGSDNVRMIQDEVRREISLQQAHR